MKKKKRTILIIVSAVVAALLLALAIPFSIYGVKSVVIENDYVHLFKENKITTKKIENVPLVKQDISCGYAIIEMLSSYYAKPITEEELSEKNKGAISTATTGGFVNEINQTIAPGYKAKEYLKNDELLLTINKSLLNNDPVPVEWAALFEGKEWTIHWSIVTGMDQEKIYINNPYGYEEVLSYDEFISRTTYKAFENMHLGYQFGFAFGLFSKNTVIVKQKNHIIKLITWR